MNVSKLFSLKDKTIFLTGAAGNLGKQYSIALSQVGANVILADKNFKGCKDIATELREKYKTDPLPIEIDLGKINSIKNAIKKSVKKYSKIDVLINNAAYQGNNKIRTMKFEDVPLDVWNEAISTNLTSIFILCQEVSRIMKKQKKGNIINISSTYGLVAPDQRIYGDSGQNAAAFYSASKSGILNLTRYLASYLGKDGIRVNTLTPGGVKNNQDKNFIKNYESKTMIGRMAKNDEYVGAMIFLASEASSYMTGSNLIIDGGWTAW